jgi:hypothetical protein
MSQTSLKKILNFGDVQFFADATIYVCIFVSQKSGDKLPVLACSLNSKNYHGEFEKEVNAATFEFPAENFGASEWSIRNKLHDSVLQKMNVGTALKDMPITINYGLKTGYNDAFFIDGKTREKLISEDAKSAEIIKPLLRGRDIDAWRTEKEDQYILFVPWHFPLHLNPNIVGCSKEAEIEFEKEYPAVYKHLLSYKEKLSARNKAETGVRYEWYALQRWAADYYKEFAKPKIMYPNMTSVFPFTYDETGSFGNDKSFIITEKTTVIASEAKQSSAECHPGAEGDRAHLLKALLAIFNSNLVKLWIWYNCPELMGGTREIRKAYFENLRIPLDNAKLLHQLATLADEIIVAKTNGEDTASLEEKVNKNVYKLYGVTDIMDRNVKK